jgi:hypothetical protein
MKCLFTKYVILANLVASILTIGCNPPVTKKSGDVISDSLYLKNVPSQPGEDTWKFIEDMKSPILTQHAWEKVVPGSQQADLSAGVKIHMGFPNSKGCLKAADEDLRLFFTAGGVSCENGKYLLEIIEDKELKGESFRLDIKPSGWKEEGLHPIRVDMEVHKKDGGITSWCPDNLLTNMLVFGSDNPADLGWLLFRN